MRLFHSFQKRVLSIYILSSLTAVFGVGSVFIFHTLELSTREVGYLVGIMMVSVLVMLSFEYAMYLKHIRPIREFFSHPTVATVRDIEAAYLAAHRFPTLTVKRILGPHLFGLSIPASVLTFLAIYFELISLPYHYIALAWSGAVLIAMLHALIEFFLIAQATEPIILHISGFLTNPSAVEGKYLVSIRLKLLMSSLIIAILPVTLFILATQIRTSENVTGTYWSWASVIIFVILVVSVLGSLLMYRSIEQPIQAMRAQLDKVQQGQFQEMKNVYSDEFSNLVNGFNTMVKGIKDRDRDNEQLLESFFTVFAATLDARDSYTAGHTNRVADYSIEIAEHTHFSPEEKDLLRKSALLHDIGKIGIRDEVLLKEGKLTDEEFEQIKLHPTIGASILEQVALPEHLLPILSGVKHHHERYDGGGYPSGLAGENIPLFGRVIAVADAFDAMTSDRPYRKGMPKEKALRILEEGKGSQWDPYYAEVFIQIQRGKET